jgi:hypothetical protein
MRRFMRLTNAFPRRSRTSKRRWPSLMWYDFGRVHQTLRLTPAMEVGVSDHVWTLAEIVALLD